MIPIQQPKPQKNRELHFSTSMCSSLFTDIVKQQMRQRENRVPTTKNNCICWDSQYVRNAKLLLIASM